MAPIAAGCAAEVPARRGSGPDDGAGDFACELGVLNSATSTEWELLSAAQEAELVLGFQGFLFVRLAVWSEESHPGPFRALTSLFLEDGTSTGGEQPGVVLAPDDQGGFVSGEIMVYFSSGSPTTYVDRRGDFGVRLEDGAHTCVAQGSALLVDRDPCVHAGGADPICPGDGSDPTASDTGTGR